MVGTIIIVLLILWFLGYIHISSLNIPRFPLFVFNGKAITLWDILVFIVILWAIEALPSPLRQIAMVLILFWVLSAFGILAFAAIPHIIIWIIIIGLIVSLF